MSSLEEEEEEEEEKKKKPPSTVLSHIGDNNYCSPSANVVHRPTSSLPKIQVPDHRKSHSVPRVLSQFSSCYSSCLYSISQFTTLVGRHSGMYIIKYCGVRI